MSDTWLMARARDSVERAREMVGDIEDLFECWLIHGHDSMPKDNDYFASEPIDEVIAKWIRDAAFELDGAVSFVKQLVDQHGRRYVPG